MGADDFACIAICNYRVDSEKHRFKLKPREVRAIDSRLDLYLGDIFAESEYPRQARTRIIECSQLLCTTLSLSRHSQDGAVASAPMDYSIRRQYIQHHR